MDCACRAVQKSDCYHFTGTTSSDPDPSCHFSQTPWILFMGALQIVFSQIQDIDRWDTATLLPRSNRVTWPLTFDDCAWRRIALHARRRGWRMRTMAQHSAGWRS